MKTNLSHLDRALRLGGGLFLLATPILDLKTYPYNLFGALLIATAAFGYSPSVAILRGVFSRTLEPGARHPTHGFGQLGGPRERHQSG